MRRLSQKNIATIHVEECSAGFCFFFFRSLMVSDLAFRSLMHFKFNFVCGGRECSNFILLHVAVVFLAHLLKTLSFLHCVAWPPLS